MELLDSSLIRYEEELKRAFGNRESSREIRNALLLAKQGKITDELIEKYKEQKERERAEYSAILTEVNPSYAFQVGDLGELTKSNSNINDVIPESTDSGNAAGEYGNTECGGNENVISLNSKQPMHSTQRGYEITRDV